MFRTALCLLLALFAVPAHAETTVPLTVGAARIEVAVDDDMLRLSTQAPSVYDVTAAGLPPASRLVDGFISKADAKRALLGQRFEDPFFQIQVLRAMEPLDFTAGDWAQLLPALAKGIGAVDGGVLARDEADFNKRIGDAADKTVVVHFGEVSKPTIYAMSAAGIRFTMLIPMSMQVDGQTTPLTLECATAVVRLRGKAVLMSAYRTHHDGDDASAVQALIDHFADRALAINDADPVAGAPPPPPPPAPAAHG